MDADTGFEKEEVVNHKTYKRYDNLSFLLFVVCAGEVSPLHLHKSLFITCSLSRRGNRTVQPTQRQ